MGGIGAACLIWLCCVSALPQGYTVGIQRGRHLPGESAAEWGVPHRSVEGDLRLHLRCRPEGGSAALDGVGDAARWQEKWRRRSRDRGATGGLGLGVPPARRAIVEGVGKPSRQ